MIDRTVERYNGYDGKVAWLLGCLDEGEMTCYIQRRPAIFRDGKSAIPNCGVVFSWAWYLKSNTHVTPDLFVHLDCYHVSIEVLLTVGIQDHAMAGIQGHAVTEAPTGVARPLLYMYIVRASPSFLFHPLYKSFYHTFHQVMSPDRRAYSLKKHSIVLYTPTIVYLVPPQVCRPQKSERQNATWPRYNNERFIINHQPATKCYSILFSCW